MAALSLEEFYARRLRSALMFAERAEKDLAICQASEPDDGDVASALGHLRLCLVDLDRARADLP